MQKTKNVVVAVVVLIKASAANANKYSYIKGLCTNFIFWYIAPFGLGFYANYILHFQIEELSYTIVEQGILKRIISKLATCHVGGTIIRGR
jgi:hypothetical protein